MSPETMKELRGAVGDLEVELARQGTEQKWHRWLLIAALASSAWGQLLPTSAPPAAVIEWLGRVIG